MGILSVSFYICSCSHFQEFSIEIPDEEADQISTVQQGMASPTDVQIMLNTSLLNSN